MADVQSLTKDKDDENTEESQLVTDAEAHIDHGLDIPGNQICDDGLNELGVVGYDQSEFEAGIMKDLDDKADRVAKEQQRKFAMKELREIGSEIRQSRDELNKVSKLITTLLQRPINTIIVELNKQKTIQTEKKSHLLQLISRERQLKDCIEKDNFESLDSMSVLSNMSMSHDQKSHDLIKTGLLTPFGTTSTDKGVGSLNMQSAPPPAPPTKGLTEFDWLGIQEQPADTLKGKGKGPKHRKASSKYSRKGLHSPSKILDNENGNKTRNGNEAENGNKARNGNGAGNGNEVRNGNEATTGNGSEDMEDELSGSIGEIRKRKQRPRPSDTDSSDDDLIHLDQESTKKSKRDGCGQRDGRGTRDDGDIRLYKERIRQYQHTNSDEDLDTVEFNGGFKIQQTTWDKLYRYQQTGVKWLWELHCQQAGGIMGDEMGLGKTIQMVAFLSGLKISNLRSHVTRRVGLGPVLIVSPATVLYQWVSEFHKWSPLFRVAVLHDTGSFMGTKAEFLKALTKSDGVVITTYANVRIYSNMILGYEWDYVVLDEGHKIRNPDAEITLTCKQFATPHRIILSGSPMQNNLRELWSLLDFVFPGKLGTLPVFMEQFSVPITIGGYTNASQMQVETAYQCACILRDTINPYLLRRLKNDVKIQLPNKNEQVLFCRLTDYQRELYEDYIKGPEVQDMMAGRRWIFTGLMKLRKLCNHPDLVTSDYQIMKGAELEDDEMDKGVESGKGAESDKLIDTTHIRRSRRTRRSEGVEGEEDVFGHYSRSGKMVVVETLLKIWLKQKHKVLLFTQSKLMLKIFEKFIVDSGYSFIKMDGTTAISSRQKLIKRFNEDPSIFIFLLTTRVGGLGVNLTGADRIIIYDPDWNPSTDSQAKERAWRIGQTRPVTIYRLLTAGTIEEKIYHRQIFKQFLTNRVLRDPRQRRFFKSNDLYELFTLGSSDGPHNTETGAIFAGTGSEVKIQPETRSGDRRIRKRKNRTEYDSEDETKTTRKRRKSSKEKQQTTGTRTDTNSITVTTPSNNDMMPPNKETTPGINTSDSKQVDEMMQKQDKMEQEPDKKDQDQDKTNQEEDSTNHDHDKSYVEEPSTDKGGTQDTNNDDTLSMEEILLLLERRKRKKKKRQKKMRHKSNESMTAEIDGHRVKGLERMDTYEPGSEDEEDKTTDNQNNMVLKKLFSKTGVATAIHHDTIISSGDPDYAIVESQANRIAKSAARALKDSRKRCLGVGGASIWGQPTWTGIHGTSGAPKKRFGSSNQQSEGSSTSSSVLLTKIKKRNSRQPLSSSVSTGIHSTSDNDLMKRIRDFVALACKKNGQATTKEILDNFTSTLHPSESPLFRSMLHEICDFHRYHGDGIWTLKAEYR